MIAALACAFLLGGFIVWRMNSSTRRDASSWRIAATMATPERPWWYALDVMRSARANSGHLYVTLMRFETQGLVERRWDPDGLAGHRRAQYRWIGPVQPPEVGS